MMLVDDELTDSQLEMAAKRAEEWTGDVKCLNNWFDCVDIDWNMENQMQVEIALEHG
jgi:hypothetical protein